MEPSSRDAARFSCGTWTALLDDGAGITLRWLHGPVAEGLHTMTSWDLFSWEKNRTLQIPSKMDAESDMPMGESARNVFIANSCALTGAWSLGCLDLICSRTWRQSWCFLSTKLASLLETIPYLKLTQSGCLLQRMNMSVLNETKCWMNEKCIYMHRKTRLFRSI